MLQMHTLDQMGKHKYEPGNATVRQVGRKRGRAATRNGRDRFVAQGVDSSAHSQQPSV